MQSDDGRRGGGGKGAATDKPTPDSIVKLRPPVGILYAYQNVFKIFWKNVTERKRREKSRKLIVAVVTTTGR